MGIFRFFHHGTARCDQKENDSMFRPDVHCVAKGPHRNGCGACYPMASIGMGGWWVLVKSMSLGIRPGTPRPTIYKWLFQLDDSKSLHRKWQTSILNWLFLRLQGHQHLSNHLACSFLRNRNFHGPTGRSRRAELHRFCRELGWLHLSCSNYGLGWSIRSDIVLIKTNIAPENQWLEDETSLWNGPFFVGHVNFRGGGYSNESMQTGPHGETLSLWLDHHRSWKQGRNVQ